jgi:PAS domain S-box-containing protein
VSSSALNLGGSHAFRSVLEVAAVPCWIHSEGFIRYANPPLAKLLQAPDPTVVIGRRTAEVLAPRTRDAFELRVARLMAGEEVPREEEELVLADGSSVPVEVVSSVVPYEGDRTILSFFHDITERRRVEAAHRQSELRYRRLVEGDMVGVVEVDAKGIVDANDTFLRMVGHSREELHRRALKWETLTAPEYAHLDREKLAELLATGECKPFEKECVRPDNSRIPILQAASLIAREPEWRAICLASDLTDRRKLQEARAEKIRLESVGVLAAGMAHSLNNLLTGVIGNASLLVEHRLVPENSRAHKIVEDILKAGERAARLTAQLLAYSGQGRFVVGATDVRETIQSQIQEVSNEIPENIRVTVAAEEDLPAIVADPKQLRYMVHGLLMNAIEAIGTREKGQIVVSAHMERVGENMVVTRSGEPLPAGEYCVIAVRDNGSGMDTNTLAHAFDPFFSTKFPGRGLGLAAISGIVRASRGAIRVSSSPKAGSVFEIYLPRGGNG